MLFRNEFPRVPHGPSFAVRPAQQNGEPDQVHRHMPVRIRYIVAAVVALTTLYYFL